MSGKANFTGFESPASEYKQSPLDFNDLLVDRPTATYVGLAVGDDMRSYGIFDGDILIIDRAAEKSDEDIVVCIHNGEFYCRCIERSRMRLKISETDPNYIQLSAEDEYIEEGVVVRSVRLHRTPGELCSR